MKLSILLFAALVTLLNLFRGQAFVLNGAATGASSFVVSRSAAAATVHQPRRASSSSSSSTKTALFMGGSRSKFGIFSPAVYAAKIVLGKDKLNKIRGKAISLHSEKITQFCEFFGAYHLRTKVIKKAKVNGDTLGFLV